MDDPRELVGNLPDGPRPTRRRVGRAPRHRENRALRVESFRRKPESINAGVGSLSGDSAVMDPGLRRDDSFGSDRQAAQKQRQIAGFAAGLGHHPGLERPDPLQYSHAEAAHYGGGSARDAVEAGNGGSAGGEHPRIEGPPVALAP